ncbi:MAG TPA: OmpA family protein [Pirellulales bacterium]|jgi:flagellar motor protein MotB|nr:OmpA family protein [Pirellulales bacterium]
MPAARTALTSSACLLLMLGAGCQVVPKTHLDAAESNNRTLFEQKNSLLAENENLRTHSRRLEDQVKQAEEELAALEENAAGRVARTASAPLGRADMPVVLHKRLVQLSRQHEGLEFDPETGASKLDMDVLFDSGRAEIRAEAEPMLDEFANLLKSPEARELRVMVVGHTDNRRIGKRETRERYPDNWHLASARALAVAEYLQERGVREEQLGVTAFGKHQPIASNQSAAERQRNRRVEIFITGPNTPIVGWTETTTDLY